MATKNKAKYPCSQQDFYSAARTIWSFFMMFLPDFTAHKARYKAATATDALAALDTAERMPDEKRRNDPSESARQELVEMMPTCTGLFITLKTYIDGAYAANMRIIKYEAAGQEYFTEATRQNWTSVSALYMSMMLFIADNTATLTANENMPAGFEATVTTAAGRFNAKYSEYKLKAETGVATAAKVNANNACYESLKAMIKDGKAIYRENAEMLELFNFSRVVEAINPSKAGIRGMVTDVTTDEAVTTATVSVKYVNEPVIVLEVREDGTFSREVKGGKVTMTIQAENYEPLVLDNVEILKGTILRRDIKLQRAA